MRTKTTAAVTTETDRVGKFCCDVARELSALREIGTRVPRRAFALAADRADMTEYHETMSVSECADMLIIEALSR